MKSKSFLYVVSANSFAPILFQFIFFVFISSCSDISQRNTVVHGKIIGKKINEIIYSNPLNGICYWGFADTAKVDSLGNFQLEMETPITTFMKFIIDNKQIDLIVEPGENISFSVDFTNDTDPLIVKGKNMEGQLFINQLPNPPSLRISGSTNFLDSLNLTQIQREIEDRYQNDSSMLRQLLEDKKISNDFYELLLSDRLCYYEGLKATHLFLRFMKVARKDLTLFSADERTFWNDIFTKNPVADRNLLYTRWWYNYTSNFLNMKEYLAETFSVDELMKFYENGEIHTHNLNIAKEYLNGEMLELYSAIYLKDAAIQKDYEKELITLFEDFKQIFPQSLYSDYISNEIQLIADFHEAQDEGFEINFLESPEKLNSLDDCIKQFKGKPLFIDVWASWCGPCKEEFAQNDRLNKLLMENGFELLYISIDDDQRKKSWEEMIKGYKLRGKHIRANQSLNSDLRKIYDQDGLIAIPWHIIVDEFGNIAYKHAQKPSKPNELEKQLLSVKSIK